MGRERKEASCGNNKGEGKERLWERNGGKERRLQEGGEERDRKRGDKGHFLLTLTRAIYEKLAGAVQEDQGVVYTQRVEDIAPNIRYCLYNIGESSDINQLMSMRNVSDVLASKINVSR